MAVQLSLRTGVLTAMLEGEIDHHTAREMREAIDGTLARVHPGMLVLDFSGVRFMDSSGVGLILGRYKLLAPWGGKILLQNLSPGLERLILLAGLADICTIQRRDKHEADRTE